MAVPGEVTARDRGLGHAMRIQRDFDPAQWRTHIDAIADADEREVAREYLRGIWRRSVVARAARADIERRERERQIQGDAEWL